MVISFTKKCLSYISPICLSYLTCTISERDTVQLYNNRFQLLFSMRHFRYWGCPGKQDRYWASGRPYKQEEVREVWWVLWHSKVQYRVLRLRKKWYGSCHRKDRQVLARRRGRWGVLREETCLKAPRQKEKKELIRFVEPEHGIWGGSEIWEVG